MLTKSAEIFATSEWLPGRTTKSAPLYSCRSKFLGFPQPSRRNGVEKSRLFHSHGRVSVNETRASGCYESDPKTYRCLLTKIRAVGCALLQNESSDVVWSEQTFLYVFRGAKPAGVNVGA